MTTDEYFLSTANPVANADQRDLEAKALRLLERPELQKARAVASFLWREVMEHPARDQMSRFDGMIDEYMFHYALRTVSSDACRPTVLRFMTPPHRWFGRDVPGSRWAGDSPDFTYRIIPVAHGSRYEIRGWATCANPPTVNYALMSDNTAAPGIMGLVDSLDVPTDGNGHFVITVDASPAEGRKNHLQTQPGAHQIWIRDALGDWLNQTPNALRIQRLAGEDRAPPSEEELAQRAAKGLLDGVYYAYYATRSTAARAPNQLDPPASSAPFGGMATQFTAKVNIVLADDEAMVITASGSGALFRNAVLHDLFLLSLDYWSRTGSLNMNQMAADADGRFTYVVAHEDPGVRNWLDTGGLRQTIFGQRWQAFRRDGSTETPTISARVVKLRDLEAALPTGVRRIDAAGRREQVAEREAGFKRRFIDR